jgi:hypothetical protein
MLPIAERHDVPIKEDYFPLLKGRYYTVVEEHYDYVVVRHQGKNLSLPKNFIGLPEKERTQRD